MRLDLFLKTSCLVKRRAIAKHLCTTQRVRHNNILGKPSREVKVGDIIVIEFPAQTVTIQVEELPASKNISRDQARELYRILETNNREREERL